MSEAFKKSGPNEELLNALFGTWEEINEMSNQRLENARREVIELPSTVISDDGHHIIVDEWEAGDL